MAETEGLFESALNRAGARSRRRSGRRPCVSASRSAAGIPAVWLAVSAGSVR